MLKKFKIKFLTKLEYICIDISWFFNKIRKKFKSYRLRIEK